MAIYYHIKVDSLTGGARSVGCVESSANIRMDINTRDEGGLDAAMATCSKIEKECQKFCTEMDRVFGGK